MENRYITDTDFLPKELTHFHGWFPNEITDDLYQIAYGVFNSCACLYDVYGLVTSIINRQKIPALRRFKLLSWKKSLESIVKSLNTNYSKDYRVIIYIPFMDYKKSLSEAIDCFRLAIFTIDEALNGIEPSIPEPQSIPAVPDIKTLFEKTFSFLIDPFNNIGKDVEEDEESGLRRLARAVLKESFVKDEMYRRGINFITINNEEIEITPSQFYHEPNRYKETFIEKGEIQEPNMDESAPKPIVSHTLDSFDPSSEYTNVRTTVMFHMLSSFVPVTKENKYRVMALFNYAFGKVYDIKKPKQETRDNAVRKYVDNCIANRLPPSNTLDFCNTVKKRLVEYGFEVPSIIEEGTEVKRHNDFH